MKLQNDNLFIWKTSSQLQLPFLILDHLFFLLKLISQTLTKYASNKYFAGDKIVFCTRWAVVKDCWEFMRKFNNLLNCNDCYLYCVANQLGVYNSHTFQLQSTMGMLRAKAISFRWEQCHFRWTAVERKKKNYYTNISIFHWTDRSLIFLILLAQFGVSFISQCYNKYGRSDKWYARKRQRCNRGI